MRIAICTSFVIVLLLVMPSTVAQDNSAKPTDQRPKVDTLLNGILPKRSVQSIT